MPTDKSIQVLLVKRRNKKSPGKIQGFKNGWQTGFEPATLGTTNRYSNQLSYNHHLFNECKYTAKVDTCKQKKQKITSNPLSY